MGWTHTYRCPGRPLKEWFEEQWNHTSDNGVTRKVLDTKVLFNVAYSAVHVQKPGESAEVFAVVTLIQYLNKDYYNFCYKDMDETMGPYERKCPASILKLLTPTTNENALKWRKECQSRVDRMKSLRGAFKVGSVLIFNEPIQFSDHTTHKLMIVRGLRGSSVKLSSLRHGASISGAYKISRNDLVGIGFSQLNQLNDNDKAALIPTLLGIDDKLDAFLEGEI